MSEGDGSTENVDRMERVGGAENGASRAVEEEREPSSATAPAAAAPAAELDVLTNSPERMTRADRMAAGSSTSPAGSSNSSGSGSSPERAAAATRPASRRVKVYKLKDDTWEDLGTGVCACHVVDPASGSPVSDTHGLDEGAWIIVKREQAPSSSEGDEGAPAPPAGGEDDFLLRTKIMPGLLWSEDDDDEHDPDKEIGGYQKQQETLIVWTERDTAADMALSFATAQGCGEVWDFIKVTKKWHDNVTTSPSLSPSLSSPQAVPMYSMTVPQLPEPTLANIEQLDNSIRTMSRSAVGRERTASAIIKHDTIQKLIALQAEAEDLESLEDLHALCRLTQFILCLNDTSIFELILRDDVILGVASILEYDPEFPTMKAAYRAHLADPTHFIEVVPIRSSPLLAKIHQTHRLHYLKDVVLARILEDSTFSMLNSAIYFNEVDIVNEVSTDPNLLKEVFALFDLERSAEAGEAVLPPTKQGLRRGEGFIGPVPAATPAMQQQQQNGVSTATQDKQHDAILFLQQLCQMAKNLQLTTRTSFFRNLADRGLLRVVEVALGRATVRDDPIMRSATVEILTALVDYDANSVRGYSLKQHGKSKSLVLFLIDLFHHEDDLGLKAQMCEALRILVDAGGEGAPQDVPARIRQEDPEAEKFLQYFYDHCVGLLAKPLLELPDPSSTGQSTLSAAQVALCGHLCDLLCFFVQFHTFRSKYFVLSSHVSQHVAKLLKLRHKNLRLSALRYFRTVIGKQDEFYNRDLMRFHLFGPILQVMYEERDRDNLLASATLEFFETIYAANSKQVIRNLVDENRDLVRALAAEKGPTLVSSAASNAAKLAPLPTFEKILARYEQFDEPQADVPNSSATGASGTASSATLAEGGGAATSAEQSADPTAESSTDMVREARGWTSVDKDEESYFAASDDDEEDDDDHNTPVNDYGLGPASFASNDLTMRSDLTSGSIAHTMSGAGAAAAASFAASKKNKRDMVEERDPNQQDPNKRQKVVVDGGSSSSSSHDFFEGAGGFIREAPLSEDDSTADTSGANTNAAQEPPEHVFRVGEMMKRKREEEDEDANGNGLLLGGGGGGAKLKRKTTVESAPPVSSLSVSPSSATTTTNGDKADAKTGGIKISIAAPTATKFKSIQVRHVDSPVTASANGNDRKDTSKSTSEDESKQQGE